jgi:DNA repair ATPase RecN
MNQRLEYLEKLEQQIYEAQAVLNRLKAEREKIIQIEQHAEIERLEEHLEQAQIRFKDLATVAEEAWQELKEVTEEALVNLNESLKKLIH